MKNRSIHSQKCPLCRAPAKNIVKGLYTCGSRWFEESEFKSTKECRERVTAMRSGQ